MRQFYQYYLTATAKLCWLRWLSILQRLTMLEGLIRRDDRNSESWFTYIMRGWVLVQNHPPADYTC